MAIIFSIFHQKSLFIKSFKIFDPLLAATNFVICDFVTQSAQLEAMKSEHHRYTPQCVVFYLLHKRRDGRKQQTTTDQHFWSFIFNVAQSRTEGSIKLTFTHPNFGQLPSKICRTQKDELLNGVSTALSTTRRYIQCVLELHALRFSSITATHQSNDSEVQKPSSRDAAE